MDGQRGKIWPGADFHLDSAKAASRRHSSYLAYFSTPCRESAALSHDSSEELSSHSED